MEIGLLNVGSCILKLKSHPIGHIYIDSNNLTMTKKLLCKEKMHFSGIFAKSMNELRLLKSCKHLNPSSYSKPSDDTFYVCELVKNKNI